MNIFVSLHLKSDENEKIHLYIVSGYGEYGVL